MLLLGDQVATRILTSTKIQIKTTFQAWLVMNQVACSRMVHLMRWWQSKVWRLLWAHQRPKIWQTTAKGQDMLQIKKSDFLKTTTVFSVVVSAKLRVFSNSRKWFKLIQVRFLSITINWARKSLKHPKIASKCYLIIRGDKQPIMRDWYRTPPPTKRLFKMSLCLFLASLWPTDLCIWEVLKAFLVLEKVLWEILSPAQLLQTNSDQTISEVSCNSRMTSLGLRVGFYLSEDWVRGLKPRDSSKVEMELQLMRGNLAETGQTVDSQWLEVSRAVKTSRLEEDLVKTSTNKTTFPLRSINSTFSETVFEEKTWFWKWVTIDSKVFEE